MKYPLSIWKETAEKSFNLINGDDFVKKFGIIKAKLAWWVIHTAKWLQMVGFELDC